ncbi:MAG: class I SAM-dependent methyltransferase [Dehalococcoidia bacterium]
MPAPDELPHGRDGRPVTRPASSRFASIAAYLDTMRSSHAPPSSSLSRAGRALVPYRLRGAAKAAGTTAAAPLAVLMARRLAREQRGLRLHLGCGPARLAGWVNIDLFGSNADLFWDVRRPLPFPAGSVLAAYSEQLLEQLTFTQVQAHIRDCYRLLRSGGVLRLGAEDFARYAQSYAGDGRFIERVRPGRPTRLLAIAELAYRNGHRSFWDAETLCALLREAGFHDVQQRRFGDSAIAPAPDREHNRQETFYVEGVR